MATPQQTLDAFLKSLNDGNAVLQKSAEEFNNLYILQQKMGALSEQEASRRSIQMSINQKYAKQIEAINKAFVDGGKIGKEIVTIELQRIGRLKDLDKALLKNLSYTSRVTEETNKLTRARASEIEGLTMQGKHFQAGMKKFADGFRNLERDPNLTGFRKGADIAAHGSQGVIGAAQDPASAMSTMAGPWGMLLKFIVDIIDKVRRLTGELSAASAASGDFVGSMERASKEAMTLSKAGAGLDMLGFSVDELAETFKTLKGTGIRAFGEMGGALTTHAKAVIAYSKTAGESQDAVAQRMASLVRNFGVSSDKVEDTYTKIIDSAVSAAKKGYITTSGYMQLVQSLGETFADTGVSITGVNKILSSVGDTMSKLGRPMQSLQKIASGIMGITKAGEGWQVFMARMSGVQGGYASTLFKAQQRGPGGMLPKAGQMDPEKYVEMARNMLLKPTAGIADQSTRQLMIEKLGSQMGMDTETTQVFQKMSAGKMGAGEAGTTLKKMWDEAKKQNMSTKGMFDIIKNILTNLIAYPVLRMYEIMKAGANMLGGGDADESKAGIDSYIEGKLGGGETHAAGARRVTQAGWAMLGTGEGTGVGGNAVTPVGRMAKTTPFRGGSGGAGITMNATFQVDPTNLAKVHRQFDNMLQAGLSDLQNRMMSNTAS